MKKVITLLAVLFCITSVVYAQDNEQLTHTMGYSSIIFKPNNKSFFKRYMPPGQEGVCGIYTAYNKKMYTCDGQIVDVTNTDYILDALVVCCTNLVFDDGPRPYAMFNLDATITRVDYETNTIYAQCEGGTLEIQTFNKEIDAWYKRFGKQSNLTNPMIHLILRNWNYTPESEDSYTQNLEKPRKRVKFKSKKAKNQELYLHESEYYK
jgi:hypothetical protein